MDYEIVRSKRRTVALQLRGDGSALVRAPLKMSEAAIAQFVESHRAWLERARQKQAARQEKYPEPTAEERKLLIEKAKAVLPGRIAHFSSLLGLSPTAVRITGAKTRFGSCSGKNALSFSWYLMRYPDEAIDLVVAHELCHIAHHDHSSAFYALLASVLPDHKERAKLLKE
ncbi:MAG: M48 family metallopeptidase [Oscillospiraceae bacterium]|nr:M48 family metallopeptidase [Oscillospiraceae bacterium]